MHMIIELGLFFSLLDWIRKQRSK